MAYTVLPVHVKGSGLNGVTTSGIDTTGADLIVIGVTSAGNIGAPTLSDSKSNTWTGLTETIGGGFIRDRLFYCQGGTVGSSHTFTLTGVGTVSGLCALILSGSVASPADQQAGAAGTGTTIQPGSVTPGEDNEIVVAGIGWYTSATAPTIGSSFTISDSYGYDGSDHYGGALAYLIQTTAGAINPTWTFGASQTMANRIATFKAAAVGGSLAIPVLTRQYRQRWTS